MIINLFSIMNAFKCSVVLLFLYLSTTIVAEQQKINFKKPNLFTCELNFYYYLYISLSANQHTIHKYPSTNYYHSKSSGFIG